MDLSKRPKIDLPLSCFLLVLLCLHGVEGASFRHHARRQKHEATTRRDHYYEPCGSKTTAAPLDAILSPEMEDPLHEHLDILSKEADIAKTYVSSLMRKYLNERVRTNREELESLNLDGLPSVPVTTYGELMELHTREQTHKSLQATYERLVAMDMYLNIIKLEENLHHGELGYGPQLEGISQSHIFSLLCRIRVAMSQHRMVYDSSHIKAVINHEVRDVTNAAVRYISDYIILRELKKILEHVTWEFSVLRNELIKTRT